MSRGGRKESRPPARTCLGCRAVRNKWELRRIVVTPDGVVSCEGPAPLPGRGAYVCETEACVDRAARQLARALRRPGLSVTPARLREAIQASRGPGSAGTT